MVRVLVRHLLAHLHGSILTNAQWLLRLGSWLLALVGVHVLQNLVEAVDWVVRVWPLSLLLLV